MKKISRLLFGIMMCALVVSCSEIYEMTKGETSYLPFRSSEVGKWGMMGTDGKALFEEEFKDQPTMAMNGRFLVRNGNGTWEIYTAEAKPEKVGDEYVGIADFTYDVTPAVKRNERITLIDTDGNVTKTLEKADGKNIVGCMGFSYGLAQIYTEDERFGIIDDKGEVVVSPKYEWATPVSSNKILTLTYKDKNDKNVAELQVHDRKGNVLMKMQVGDGQKYTNINPDASTPKYLAVCSSVDGEMHWGFIDYEKNVIVKPSSRIKTLGALNGNMFIFSNGDGWGVMNFDGEVLIRAKYDMLGWANENTLIAYDVDTKYSLVGIDGTKITQEEYLNILPFYDGEHAAVKVDDNSWEFINTKGEELRIKNAPDIYTISENRASAMVESEYVDIDAIMGKLKLAKNGLMGYSLTMSPLQVLKNYNEIASESDGKRSLDPADNSGKDNATTSYSSRGIDINSKIYYSGYMTEYDYESGKTIWSKEKPRYIQASVSGSKLSGKTDLVYSKVAALAKTYGKVLKENSRAVIVQVSEGMGWIITDDGSTVNIELTTDSYSLDKNIDRYAKEEETTREYAKPATPKENTDYSSSTSTSDNYSPSSSSSSSYSSQRHYNLHGSISSLPITMEFTINGSSVNGTYYYNKYGSDARITLRGEVVDGQIVLREYDSNGVKYGDFRGYLINGEYSGTFSDKNGKGMSFSLHTN